MSYGNCRCNDVCVSTILVSTQLCPTETRRRGLSTRARRLFPHNYVLRKRRLWRALQGVVEGGFHTIMSYGNPYEDASCGAEFPSFHTIMSYGNPSVSPSSLFKSSCFHTIMSYGNFLVPAVLHFIVECFHTIMSYGNGLGLLFCKRLVVVSTQLCPTETLKHIRVRELQTVSTQLCPTETHREGLEEFRGGVSTQLCPTETLKIRIEGIQKQMFPHNYVLRKQERVSVDPEGRPLFPHNYVLRKQAST